MAQRLRYLFFKQQVFATPGKWSSSYRQQAKWNWSARLVAACLMAFKKMGWFIFPVYFKLWFNKPHRCVCSSLTGLASCISKNNSVNQPFNWKFLYPAIDSARWTGEIWPWTNEQYSLLYWGPQGISGNYTGTGTSCGNCHQLAGTKPLHLTWWQPTAATRNTGHGRIKCSAWPTNK